MPEAAVNEYDGTVLRQNYVWVARKASLVKTEVISHRVQHRAYGQFRFGALGLDARHYLTTLLGSENVDPAIPRLCVVGRCCALVRHHSGFYRCPNTSCRTLRLFRVVKLEKIDRLYVGCWIVRIRVESALALG
jgi:hypothetical protein